MNFFPNQIPIADDAKGCQPNISRDSKCENPSQPQKRKYYSGIDLYVVFHAQTMRIHTLDG
jgi:hypothetical protein